MIAEAAALGLGVAASLLLGALVAARSRLPTRMAAALTAFGGGVLLAAAALELVPEADAQAGLVPTAAGLVAGMLVYVTADTALTRREDTAVVRRSSHAAAAGSPMALPENAAEIARGESIAVGLLVDGVPESLALGLTVAEGDVGLALLVGVVLGNVLEAYGAAQPIVAGGRAPRFAVGLLGGIGLALGLATVLGVAFAEAPDEAIGFAEAVAAGAVLAVLAVAIVPYVFEQVHRVAAVAVVLGFALGYVLS